MQVNLHNIEIPLLCDKPVNVSFIPLIWLPI